MPNLDSIANLNTIDSLVVDSVISNPVIIHDTIYSVSSAVTTPIIDDQIQFVSHNINQSIPLLLIIGLIIIGVAIYTFYKLLTDYITPFLHSHYKIKRPQLLLYRLKISTWIAYIIFCFYQLISSHLIIGISIALFVIVAGLFIWKDLIAGIFNKLEDRIKIKDYISIEDNKGTIKALNTRNFELLTQNDHILTIPNHKLLNCTVAKRLNKGEERSRVITLTVAENSKLNSIRAIENSLNYCPWLYTHKPSIVKKINNNQYAISIYVADNFTFQKVENYLNNKS